MKNILFLLSAALMVSVMSATYGCQKSQPVEKIVKDTIRVKDTVCPPVIKPVTGLWEGEYLTDQVAHPATYLSFSIFPNGTFSRRSKVVNSNEVAYSSGRWWLTGNNFQYLDTFMLYTGGNVIFTGGFTYNPSTNSLTDGTYRNVGGQTHTGTFINLKRVD